MCETISSKCGNNCFRAFLLLICVGERESSRIGIPAMWYPDWDTGLGI